MSRLPRHSVTDATHYHYDANGNPVRERRLGNAGIPSISNQILLSEHQLKFDALDRPYEKEASILVNGAPLGGLDPEVDRLVTTTTRFDANGKITQVLDDNGHAENVTYDGLNRVLTKTDALGNIRKHAYDANSNLISLEITEVNPEGLVQDKIITTSFAYDTLNRLTQSTNNIGNSTQYRYDSRSNLISEIDPLGNTTLTIFDGINRKLEERKFLSPLGIGQGGLDFSNPSNNDGAISTFYQWDGNSRLSSQSDDKSNQTSYTYDALNRLKTTRYADNTQVVNTYDSDSNLISKTDQNASVFSFQYDALNRLTQRSVIPAPGLVGSTLWQYTYDGLNRRTQALDNNDPKISGDDASVQWRYNSLGHILSETNGTRTTQVKYDGLGHPQSMTYPNGRVIEYERDAIYQIQSIRDTTNNSPIVSYDYAGSGRVIERRFGNSTQLKFHNSGIDSAYDGINRILEQKHNHDTQVIAGFSYAYDKAHNRRFEQDLFKGVTDAYEYDSAYRLTRAAYEIPNNNPLLSEITNNQTTNQNVSNLVAENDVSWMIDGVDNWVSKQVLNKTGSSAEGYQINQMNEYNRIGATAQIHDANGNLTHDGNRRYAYDALNRLVRVSTLSGNTAATYNYDALGRRTRKVAGSDSSVFHYFGQQVLEEASILGQLQKQFVYGARIDDVLQLRSGTQDYYYHKNSIGSVVALTDDDGAVVERYDYDAYGVTTILEADGVTEKPKSSIGNPYAYTGRRLDSETDLYYYRARFYSPQRGRFIQRDPLGYVDGMGHYAYVGNNPINWIDPEGTFRFGKRPLNGLPWIPVASSNSIDDFHNAEISHEHGFFDDGSNENIGFREDGRFSEDVRDLDYRYDDKFYNDDIMREALNNVEDGKYSLMGFGEHEKNNCQDWAERLREEYHKIYEQRKDKK